mmetsp:Transcript_23618/g.44927  ORF Transcript_23618/g.44927 Transcript_23618/m.44927 type:complete len:243 (+) Transcript_23618:158-886(+)
MARHLAAVVVLLLSTSGSRGFDCNNSITNRRRRPSTFQTVLCGELTRSNKKDTPVSAEAADALAFLNQAKALRAQASEMRQQLEREKEEKARNKLAKVDSLIDSLLFYGLNNDAAGRDDDGNDGEAQQKSKQQLLHTEEQVVSLLISKRMNYDLVNQMFDRICEQANRPQSIDSCSPLLSLLLDAACKVDCMERKDNPNKRWNHRVERDLRRKLWALGHGIRIEDVENENRARSITGERDYS